ncbi:hypothetical protein IC582_018929 [Cucumis melo]|uniref:Uncharacterized protein LOC103495809 isoform X1 n=1 Tax=Cucumis melo TaxID=3656 RepID=A0A1S3C1F9_CUCME|nr:uncharacterized protein LOC103495809 isoform X1 [Cucumis melo]
MSTGTVRRIPRQDIQLVRSLIERCLQLDMSRKEVVETLLNQEKIDPGFTEHVWQKLEEENREFFNAYYLRLMVKSQIIEFNRLLEQQARMMHQIHPCAVTALSSSNGSHVQPIHQSCYAPEHTGPTLKQDDIDHPVGVSIGNVYSNGTQPVHSTLHTAVDMSSHTRNDAAPQTSNVGLFQGMNGGMIKVETGYSNSSHYMFGTEGNVLDAHQSIGNASVASFASVDSNTPSFNESLLDPDPSSFGFINQITRNFSLSDLTADFSQGSDMLESYGRCPFLPTEADNIIDTCENGDRLDSKRLDNVSESLSYEDFRHN